MVKLRNDFINPCLLKKTTVYTYLSKFIHQNVGTNICTAEGMASKYWRTLKKVEGNFFLRIRIFPLLKESIQLVPRELRNQSKGADLFSIQNLLVICVTYWMFSLLLLIQSMFKGASIFWGHFPSGKTILMNELA